MNPARDTWWLSPATSWEDARLWLDLSGYRNPETSASLLCLAAASILLLLRVRERTAFTGFLLGWLGWLAGAVRHLLLGLVCPPTHTPETEVVAQALAAFAGQTPLVLIFLFAAASARGTRDQIETHRRMVWPTVLATLNVSALVFPFGLFASREVNPIRYTWECWF